MTAQRKNRGQHRNENMYRSSPERYTPDWLLDMIVAFLGDDYFDPCPARENGPLQFNGLAITWQGKVYCNPPYGSIGPWITKAMTEQVDEVIMLVPAYTDTKWFQPLFSHSICFIHGRLTFKRPGHGAGGQMASPHASVLVYRGRRYAAFARHFAELGPIMRQYCSRRAKQPQLWEAAS